MKLFDPALFPSDRDSSREYSAENVLELVKHFQLNTCTLQQEWASLVPVLQKIS